METIQDRVAKFLTLQNLSMQKFERKCNLGVGSISKLTAKSYATTYAKISNAFPQLNMNWLKTGEGQMLNPATSQHAEDIEVINSEDTKINTNNSKINKRKGSATSNADLMEIIKDYQKQIQDLTQQVKEKDARIQQLTDKLLGL